MQLRFRTCKDSAKAKLLVVHHVVKPLEPRLETAFLEWRGGSDAHLRAVIQRELESQHRSERVIFVALEEKEVIGTVQLVYTHEDPELANGTTRGYVQALEVNAKHRRQGVGAALMQHLEKAARDRGFSSLALMVEPDNYAALELYKRSGYGVFKTSSWRWKEREYETFCLEKLL
jgi:ribosomal protein S18 acetylase RimI-like enzyme